MSKGKELSHTLSTKKWQPLKESGSWNLLSGCVVFYSVISISLWWFCSVWQSSKLCAGIYSTSPTSTQSPRTTHMTGVTMFLKTMVWWDSLLFNYSSSMYMYWNHTRIWKIQCNDPHYYFRIPTNFQVLYCLPWTNKVQHQVTHFLHCKSHITDLLYTNLVNTEHQSRPTLCTFYIHITKLCEGQTRPGAEGSQSHCNNSEGSCQCTMCHHQQVNPIFWSPCFLIYLWRAFSIRRALRSLKDSIRSCAERANEGADVSKHEPCRKIFKTRIGFINRKWNIYMHTGHTLLCSMEANFTLLLYLPQKLQFNL